MAKGRPKGSANTEAVVDVETSRCPNCQSTRRSEYLGARNVQEFEGLAEGRPYNRIVRRRCQCLDCGQTRIDRTFEFAPPGTGGSVPAEK
jgi:nitrate reductase cytochrome c-type subunit